MGTVSKMRAAATEDGRVAMDFLDDDGVNIVVVMSQENARELIVQIACAMRDDVESLTDRIVRMFLMGAAVYSKLGLAEGHGPTAYLESVHRWCAEGTVQDAEELRRVLELGYQTTAALQEAREACEACGDCGDGPARNREDVN